MATTFPGDLPTDIFEPVPLSLQDINAYTPDTNALSDSGATSSVSADFRKRLARMLRVFDASYPTSYLAPSAAPIHVAVAPGRVNLIGEHIDYEGYSVLPMALEHSSAIAFRAPSVIAPSTRGLAIFAGNSDPLFAFTSLTPASPVGFLTGSALFQALTQSLVAPSSAWMKYVVCGYMAVVEWKPELRSRPLTVDLLVDGTIPPACGLSSSSALVVASAMVFASVLCASEGIPMPTRTELAEQCRLAEQYIGTVGGGMDQAVSCLAQRHAALHVVFEPQLRVEVAAFPAEIQSGQAVFMVVNSGVQAHKAQDATARFNKRVIECALAAKLLAKRLTLPAWEAMTRLLDVQHALEEKRGGETTTFTALLQEVATVLDQHEFTLEELTQELSGAEPLSSLFVGSRLEVAAQQVLASETSFRLQQRARHVWGEAERVAAFQAVLMDSTTPANSFSREALHHLGLLMQQSHASCRDLYECSSPELDAIVDIAVKAGAYGARLTGAGWGGCAVLLAPTDLVEPLNKQLNAEFFHGNTPEDAVFEARASEGAQLYVCGP